MSDEHPPITIASVVRARAAELVRFHPKEVAALTVLALAITGGSVLAYARSRPAPAASLAPIAMASPSVTGGDRIVVHVTGKVKRPGVYRFDEGARVLDAVRAAGGFVRGADRAAINLARALVDGEQIVVARKGEAAKTGGASGSAAAGKLNINLATAKEFEELPGIGAVLAQRIVDHREQNGPFRDVRDLMKVSGIGQKKFESLEPYITV